MMTHPDILAALARARVNTFLSEAQAASQASLARAARSPARGKRVVLRGGSTVLIRPVRSTDAPLLADGFARLSPQSRRMRFLGTKATLSAAELCYFTDVDHHDHEAIGALSAADGRGIGIARYVRDTNDPRSAEIAVTIVDDWQGRGLGTELLARVVRPSPPGRHRPLHRPGLHAERRDGRAAAQAGRLPDRPRSRRNTRSHW
jgi:GNAT superfamily N-acetyltransferase